MMIVINMLIIRSIIKLAPVSAPTAATSWTFVSMKK